MPFPMNEVMTFLDEFMQSQKKNQAVQQQREMFEKLGLGEFLPEEPTGTWGKIGQVLRGGPTPIAGGDVGGMIAKGKIGQMYPSSSDLINQIFLSRMMQGGDMGMGMGQGTPAGQAPPQPTEPPAEGYEWELKEEKTTRAGIPSYNYRWTPKKTVETKAEKELITAPTLKPAKGFLQRGKKEFAGGLNEATVHAASKIKTKADLDDLIKNKEAYESKGVNVDAILRYYKEVIPESLSKWYGVK